MRKMPKDTKKTVSWAKKAQMGAGVGFIMGLLLLIILAVVTATIVQGVRNTQTTGTGAYNATTNGQDAVSNFTSLFPVAGTIGIAVVIIGLVVTGFAVRTR